MNDPNSLAAFCSIPVHGLYVTHPLSLRVQQHQPAEIWSRIFRIENLGFRSVLERQRSEKAPVPKTPEPSGTAVNSHMIRTPCDSGTNHKTPHRNRIRTAAG